jgi:hypothetical protein
MTCLKVLGTALALTFTVSVALAQTTVIPDLPAANKIIPDGQFAGVNDTYFLHFDYPNFINGDGQLTVKWAPNACNSNLTTFSETISPNSLLGSFNGTDPSMSWTLFLADVDFGQQSTLARWRLEVSAVPEPDSFGFVGMGALVLGAALYRCK